MKLKLFEKEENIELVCIVVVFVKDFSGCLGIEMIVML